MEPVQFEVVRVRRNPWMTALTALPLALIPIAIIATLVTGGPFAFFAPHLAIVGLMGFLASWRRMPFARRTFCNVRVDGELLHIGGESIPRADITNAELMPTDDTPIVRVTRRGRFAAENLIVNNGREAHDLLTALGFDASQRVAAYSLPSLAVVRYAWALFLMAPIGFVAMGAAARVHSAFNPVIFTMLLATMGATFLKRASLIVGADGLYLRWLWVREFIATKDILSVTRFETGFGRNRIHGIEVVTKAGRAVRLPVARSWGADLGVIKQRIEDVIELDRVAAHVEDGALLLARGERALREWIGELKAIGSGATAQFRKAAIVPEQLWRVATDTSQPAVTRAAAAVALGPTLDERGRVRLADLAKATAAPKLRVALERAAEDADDELIEEALREIES
jgi:hypothetical protein